MPPVPSYALIRRVPRHLARLRPRSAPRPHRFNAPRRASRKHLRFLSWGSSQTNSGRGFTSSPNTQPSCPASKGSGRIPRPVRLQLHISLYYFGSSHCGDSQGSHPEGLPQTPAPGATRRQRRVILVRRRASVPGHGARGTSLRNPRPALPVGSPCGRLPKNPPLHRATESTARFCLWIGNNLGARSDTWRGARWWAKSKSAVRGGDGGG